ncbi:hypothetical protein ACFU90_23505 [Streptomyces noursei]|uniref:Uncharacterized protein n=1 Tax=Streptomyces noursei TaxID=1971 RepID=A0A059W0F2_STRNR|nr:hypothetical protein [Streptomyces noursei]AKA08464.1 hypothetical protein SAZ_04525 [Streptomyces noursei ZPM]AIA01321.1 hypothetical protein DC74_799 [Streptomyces noursei]EPY92823.1 hypothetical protein K530_51170 [Streptomyces noursei CCRC 11814]EXU90077.1 hypothetical protein P354_18755 [Streptomyces noursei PD-1]UWS70244.1 hypothetical protein N1H47_02775 [Streptomyces noursei]
MPSPAVLALGTTALCASGCVWYLPAAADLRAGADRPVSRRLAAAACLTVWATVALSAPLLLAAASWTTLGAVTAVGTGAAVLLAALARARRGHEERATRRTWVALRLRPPARGRPSGAARSTRVFLCWFLPGYAVAAGALAVVLVGGR